MDKEAVARLAGMDYALKQIKEHGIENFEKELAWRKGKNFTVPLTERQIGKYYKGVLSIVKDRVCTCALYALRDEFGFGPSRAKRFFNRFYEYLQSIGQGYVSWIEVHDVVKDELGIDIDSYE